MSVYLCDAAASGLLEPISEAVARGGIGSIQSQRDPRDKRSVLHIAVQYGHAHIVSFLLEHNINANEVDIDRRTPLHYAVVFRHPELVPLLAENGANVDARDKELMTALHLACGQKEMGVAKSLVSCGADLTLRNNIGKRALDLLDEQTRRRCDADWSQVVLVRACTRLKEYKYGHNSALRIEDQRLVLSKRDESLYKFLLFAPNVVELDHVGLDAIPIPLITLIVDRGVKHLNLSFNRITALPEEISCISTLKSLDIRANKIDSLPPSLASMPVLEKVRFEGNPLGSIPSSLRSSSWSKVCSYLKAVATRASRWSEYKMLFVGEEGVGKSTLLKCIRSKKHKSSCKKNLATDGIDVHRIVFSPVVSERNSDANTKLTFKCWDLGGQEVFYPTHLLFLRSNCVYVVVFNLADPKLQRVDYWMNTIRSVTGNSSNALIFIVGTHADEKSVNEDDTAALLDSLRRKYSQFRYKGFHDAVAVSCKSGKGVKELQQRVQDAVMGANMMPVVADSWVRLHDFLSNRVEETVSWPTYQEWASTCGVPEADLLVATDFLCDAGSVIHFNDKVKDLGTLVVLNPQWLADLMSTIVTFRHRWVRNGLIQASDIPSIFEKYSRISHDTLIGLLEKFHIIFRQRGGEAYIVPSMLPETRPREAQFLWPQLALEGQHEYGRHYKFPFVPLGLFARFLVRIMHLDNVTVHMQWRNGVVCKLEGSVGQQFAMVTYDVNDVSFAIRIRESKTSQVGRRGNAELLRMLVTAADTLMDCYSKMRYNVQRLVPCIHCLQSVALVDRPFFFSYEECANAITEGVPVLYCHHIVSTSRAVMLQNLCPDLSFSYLRKIPKAAMIVGEIVGEGNSGLVRMGCLRLLDGTLVNVALKEMHAMNDIGEEKARKRLEDAFVEMQFEVALMCELSHPNLVALYGLCIDPLCMVLQYVRGGDLFSFLHPGGDDDRIPDSKFPWTLRLYFALDIARGMQHLQAINPPIIHRDLRSPNIFLEPIPPSERPLPDRTMYALVADFGLARHVAPDISGSLRTWQWMAPETLHTTPGATYDERSDIYSYGMCLWEICTCEYPFEEYADHPRFGREVQGVKSVSGMAMKQAILDEQVRPSLPKSSACPAAVKNIIRDCWKESPADRPSFDYIVETLEGLLDVSTAPTHVARNTAKRIPYEEAPDVAGEHARKGRARNYGLKLVHSIKLHGKQRATSLAQVGQWVAAGCNDGIVILYDANTYERIFEWNAHADRIHCLLSPGDGSLWSSSEDGFVRVWTISKRGELVSPLCMHEGKPFADGRPPGVRVLCAVPGIAQPTVWMWASMKTSIQVWGAGSFKDVGSVKIQESDIPVSSIAALDNQVWVATKQMFYVFDANYLTLLAGWRQLEPIFSLSPVVDCVWAGATTGNMSRWRFRDGDVELLGEMEVHTGSVKVIRRVSAGRVLSGTSDGSMILWDVDGQAREEYSAHRDVVKAILRTIKDSVWTCSFDSSISIWVPDKTDRFSVAV